MPILIAEISTAAGASYLRRLCTELAPHLEGAFGDEAELRFETGVCALRAHEAGLVLAVESADASGLADLIERRLRGLAAETLAIDWHMPAEEAA